MKLTQITTPVTSISGIGEKASKNLAKLNIFSVADLLQHFPRDWEDRTQKIPLALFDSAKKLHTVAKVLSHQYFGFGNMKTLKIIVDDGSARGSLLCFNRNFLEKSLVIGSIISLTGNFYTKYGELQSSSFEAEVLSKNGELSDYRDMVLPDSKVFSIYPLTAGITQSQMRKIINKAIKSFAKGIQNELPQNLINKYDLYNKQDAIIKIHQPDTLKEAQKARYTLIFEELYLFQRTIISRYIQRKGHLPNIQTDYSKDFLQNQMDNDGKEISSTDFAGTLSPKQKQLFCRLPFNLTPDQMQAILKINQDIDKAYLKQDDAKPMARLLQGDVGCGKTLVAFFACLRQIDYGGQCAILAPTELLAHQHADNAAALLQNTLGIKLAFLTGNLKIQGRNTLLKELKEGNIDIVIGTHALFSQNVTYKNLKLVVIDEQHRFGVIQRNAIIEKGKTSVEAKKAQSSNESLDHFVPSLLMMSATPIPQTLALSIFGDLDISTIKTLPTGRQPIKTHLTKRGNEHHAYEAVREELLKGHQAYFVYPLIEQSDFDNDLKNAEQMFEFLSTKVYPEYKCQLIHSKIDDITQNQILHDFKNKKIDIIIATSVVEVGVDNPNATCMVIEHAERFGLAALHQLRGRVGRGNAQSHCFLIYSNNLTENGKQRLKALYESTDGFFIAEQDMLLRGPGDVNGIQQSGYFTLGLADPIRDKDLLILTRKEAIENFYAT